jgi:hypothetical protein
MSPSGPILAQISRRVVSEAWSKVCAGAGCGKVKATNAAAADTPTAAAK